MEVLARKRISRPALPLVVTGLRYNATMQRAHLSGTTTTATVRQRNLRRYLGWDLRRIAHIAVGTYHPAPQPRLMSTIAGGKVDQIWTQRVHAHLRSQGQTTRSPAGSTKGERTASVRAPSSLYSTRITRSMLARRARHRRLVHCPGSPLSLIIIGCDDRIGHDRCRGGGGPAWALGQKTHRVLSLCRGLKFAISCAPSALGEAGTVRGWSMMIFTSAIRRGPPPPATAAAIPDRRPGPHQL